MALRPLGDVCSTNRPSVNLPLSLSRFARHERDRQRIEAAPAPVA